MTKDIDRELGTLEERTVNLQKSFERFDAMMQKTHDLVVQLTERVDSHECPRDNDIDNISAVVQSNTSQISKNGDTIHRIEKVIETNIKATQENTEFRLNYSGSTTTVSKVFRVFDRAAIIILMIIALFMGQFMCSIKNGNYIEKQDSSDIIEGPVSSDGMDN